MSDYGDHSPVDYTQERLAEKDRKIAELKHALGNAFVDGAKWWEFEKTGGTMWQSDQDKAAKEASKRRMPFRPVLETALEVEIERLKGILKKHGLMGELYREHEDK